MKAEARKICERMNAMIESSRPEHKPALTNWICFANWRLHQIIEEDVGQAASIAGASLALEQNYEAKFGTFPGTRYMRNPDGHL